MNASPRAQLRVLTLLLFTMPTLLGLSGCGGGADSSAAADDPSTQSVSKYESEINKSKAITPKKGRKAR